MSTRTLLTIALLFCIMFLGSSLVVPLGNTQPPVAGTVALPARSEPVSVAYDSAKGEVFVTDFGANDVSVLSDNTNSVVATILVGHSPDRIAYDSGKGEVYVTNVGDNTVSVISDVNDSVIATVPVGSYPYGIAYDSGKGEVYVTNYDSNTTSVIDDSDHNVVATIPSGSAPHGVVYDSAKGEVFVTNYNSDTVQVISDSSNTVTATISVGKEPNRIAYDSGKGEVFVTNQRDNTVSVISDSTNAVVATVPVGISPIGIAYDSGKGVIFVVNDGSNSTSVIDDSNNRVVENVTVGGEPYDATYDSAKGEVFVANYGSNSVSVISDASISTTATYSLTVTATGAGGQNFPLGIGTSNPTVSITDVAISSGTSSMSGAAEEVFTVSFTISGQSGSNGTTTVTIPKADVPSGLTPTVYVDGSPALDQSYTQDAINYYVTFTNHFSTHTVTIEFVPPSTSGGGTSPGSGGIPEFPAQFGFALITTVVVTASYIAARRKTVLPRVALSSQN